MRQRNSLATHPFSHDVLPKWMELSNHRQNPPKLGAKTSLPSGVLSGIGVMRMIKHISHSRLFHITPCGPLLSQHRPGHHDQAQSLFYSLFAPRAMSHSLQSVVAIAQVGAASSCSCCSLCSLPCPGFCDTHPQSSVLCCPASCLPHWTISLL